MPVWMRGRLALARALPQASMSRGHGARKGADGGSLDLAADQLHRLEVFGRGSGIARLDDVHVQLRQLPGDHEFLAAAQARSGGLLAVPQGGVEYGYFFRHGVVH